MKKDNTTAHQQDSRQQLEGMFVTLLMEAHGMERQLIDAFDRIINACADEQLKITLQRHAEETGRQVEKLMLCFEILQLQPLARKTPGVDGLLQELFHHIHEHEQGPALDAVLLAGVQKIEHVEIAAYGALQALAQVLGKMQCKDVFEDIKEEEIAADFQLSERSLAINQQAAGIQA